MILPLKVQKTKIHSIKNNSVIQNVQNTYSSIVRVIGRAILYIINCVPKQITTTRVQVKIISNSKSINDALNKKVDAKI